MGRDCDATIKAVVWTGTPALLRILTGAGIERFVPTEFTGIRLRRPDMATCSACRSREPGGQTTISQTLFRVPTF